ncbi:MAG: hypothetical protein Q4G69_00825 [Planctomycetia bacterium]|nr:hypothetical protein [Planctomycetia bacterium]
MTEIVNNSGSSSKIRNMNLLRVTWNGITFDCTAKELPTVKDAPTWTISTDNTLEKTARTVVGKPDGFEPIQLTIETDLSLVYSSLLSAFISGTSGSATFAYTPVGGTAASLTVPQCTICGIENVKTGNNGASTTIIKLQPEGGPQENMPTA